MEKNNLAVIVSCVISIVALLVLALDAASLFSTTNFNKLLSLKSSEQVSNFLFNTIQVWRLDPLLSNLNKFYSLSEVDLFLYYSFFFTSGLALFLKSLKSYQTFRHGREVKSTDLYSLTESALISLTIYLVLIQIFKIDLVLIAVAAWIPFLLIAVKNFLAGKLLSLAYLIMASLIFITSAWQYSLIIFAILVPALFYDLSAAQQTIGQIRNIYFKVIFFLILISSLLVSFSAELGPNNYPDNVRVVTADNRTEIYRPLVGSSLNVNINNLEFEQNYFFWPAVILLITYLVVCINHRSKYHKIYLLLPLSFVLHSLININVIKYLPLHTISLLIPNFFFGPKVAIFFILSLFITLYFNRNKIVSALLLLSLTVVTYLNNYDFRDYLAKVKSINTDHELINTTANNFLLEHSEEELRLSKRLSKKKFRSISKLNNKITANFRPADLIYLVDQNSGSSWSTKRGKMDGSEQINIEFTEPVKMQGFSLSVQDFPADYPRGIRLDLSGDCQNFSNIYVSKSWPGSIDYTEEGLPYYTPRNIVKFYFESQAVKCVKLQQTGIEANYEWRISELEYLPAKKGKKYEAGSKNPIDTSNDV